MNSAKSACDNFEPMPHNVKKDLLLFRDSPSDENKNKVIQNSLEDSMVPYLNNDLLLIDFQLVSPIF